MKFILPTIIFPTGGDKGIIKTQTAGSKEKEKNLKTVRNDLVRRSSFLSRWVFFTVLEDAPNDGTLFCFSGIPIYSYLRSVWIFEASETKR